MANSNEPKNEKEDNSVTLECAICLEKCVHPSQLPCGHVFCFLCIKGISFQGCRCALCREPFPAEYVKRPKLISSVDLENAKEPFQWYYEGANSGWWKYEERASSEIEEAFQKGLQECHLLLAGYIYVIDLKNMVQYRQANPGRKRKIKRDQATIEKLGVAGLRCPKTKQNGNIPRITKGKRPCLSWRGRIYQITAGHTVQAVQVARGPTAQQAPASVVQRYRGPTAQPPPRQIPVIDLNSQPLTAPFVQIPARRPTTHPPTSFVQTLAGGPTAQPPFALTQARARAFVQIPARQPTAKVACVPIPARGPSATPPIVPFAQIQAVVPTALTPDTGRGRRRQRAVRDGQ